MPNLTVNISTNQTREIFLPGSYSRIAYIYATHDDYVELMPTWGYATSAFVLFMIGFFGFFLNLMVIILMCKDKQLWTPLNLILFNLVCSDFFVSILGNPFTLISALSHRWVFGKTMCVAYGFFMTLLGITSITTLTVLSFERYMMVSRPLSVRQLSMRSATLSIFFIWCYSLAVSSPPLLGWGSFVHEAANISCSINWEEQSLNALTYILYIFTMGLIVPVSIIVYSYMNIIKTMKRNSMRMGRVSKAESRVTTMVLIMIITFLVAWTPYSIFALLEQFAPYDVVSPGLAVVPALVAKSSICYDPIIYVGMNSQFRASVKKIFGFGGREDSVQERGIENTLMSPTRPISQSHDNNIRLQYLNTRSNALVAVTIYPDDGSVPMSRKLRNGNTVDINNITNDKTNTKITLTNNMFDESTEPSAESVGKEPAIINDQKHTQKINKKSLSNFRKEKKEKKYVTYNFNNSLDTNDTPTDCFVRNNSKRDSTSDNSSSGNLDGYTSDDVLLAGKNYKKKNLHFGTDNDGLITWDETKGQTSSKKENLILLNNLTFKFDNSPLPVRRKSLASTRISNDYIDLCRFKNSSGRRSSGSILSGHTRKLSTTLQGTKGSIVSRLMVDEREKSKLMSFDELKSSIQRPYSNNEHML